MPNNNNTNFTANPADGDPSWISLLVVADDDRDDVCNPVDYDGFCSDYNPNNDGIFDNNDTDHGKQCV